MSGQTQMPEPSAAPSAPTPEPAEWEKTKGRAEGYTLFGILLLAIGIIVAVIGGVVLSGASDSSNSPSSPMALYIGCGLISLAFWFFLIGQLLHIRAAVEKSANMPCSSPSSASASPPPST